MIMRKFILHFLLLFSVAAFAQKSIKGKVTDESGIPLPGASVLIEGTTTGTTTDFDGIFTLDVRQGQTIVVSYIGYRKTSRQVDNQDTYDFILMTDNALDEVVVSALGFKENRDKIASTYSKMQANDVVRSGEPTLINGLAGKASGITISATSADPGAGSNIQIRGASSIIGQTQPLIIIDGVPTNNDNFEGFGSGADGGISQQSRLNDINPNDI